MGRLSVVCLSSQQTSHVALSFITAFHPLPRHLCLPLHLSSHLLFLQRRHNLLHSPSKVKKKNSLGPELGLRRRGPGGQRLSASPGQWVAQKRKRATGLKMG